MLRGATEVGVDDERVVSALGEGVSEVGQRSRFALAGAAADERHGVGVGRWAVELQIGSQDAVGLGVDRGVGRLREQMDILRDDSEHRSLEERLDVLHRLHAGIKILEKEGEADTDNQTHHGGQGHVEPDFGFGWE